MSSPGTGAVAVLPVKSPGTGKSRLSAAIGDAARRRLADAVARHVVGVAAASGLEPFIVTDDAALDAWATGQGFHTIADPGHGLDSAAGAGVEAAGTAPWLVLHTDLPLISEATLRPVVEALERGPVVAPAHDGGTNAVGGSGTMTFSFGPGSFHRHLARMPTATVVADPSLALDVDTARELAIAMRDPDGAWLAALMEDA